MRPSIKDIKDLLNELLLIAKELAKFINVLFRYKKIQLAVLLFLLVACILLGSWYWNLNHKYQKIIYNTLYLESEATPQKNKGMEAFILSYLEKDIDGELKKSRFDSEFIKVFEKLQETIKEFLNTHPGSAIETGKLDVVSKKNVDILTDDNPTGFLFVPIYILRRNFTSKDLDSLRMDSSSNNTKRQLLNEIYSEKELMYDIKFTRALSEQMNDFTNTPILEDNSSFTEPYPSQVYIITKNGINRIFSKNNNSADQARKYYGNQFPARTFFPSRPYFWPVFDEPNFYSDENSLVPSPTQPLEKLVYISHPYMDLAGNGFVITLSKGIEIKGKIKAVLCFDLALNRSPNEKTTIELVLEKISKDLDDIKPQKVQGTSRLGRLEIHGGGELVTEFQNYLNDIQINDLSSVMGNIQVFNKHTNDGTLKVSIPVGNITTDGKVEFLLFKIDLNKFRKKASWAAISLFLTFGIMIFFLSYLYGSTIKRSEEYEQAFNQVDLVMYKSFVPYCRLDARDQIKDANPAFCDTLEYDPLSEDDLKLLHRRKFSTLCADEDSLKIYKEIEEKRRLNEEVVPYKMRFRCKSGNTKELLVVSGQFPFSLKGKLPETFGILLDPNNKEQNKYFEEYKNYLFPQSSR